MNPAEQLRRGLFRLFSSGAVVRQQHGKGKKGLLVRDTDKIKGSSSINKAAFTYSSTSDGWSSPYYGAGIGRPEIRLDLMKEYEMMERDPIIASALDIYAEESTTYNEEGEVLDISSENEDITEILHNLFYDIINIEFNLTPWIRNLCKYGDFFLGLNIAQESGVIEVLPFSIYELERQEEYIDGQEVVRFVLSAESTIQLENYEVAHFRLLSDANFLPYGRSMLESGRQIWKQVTLMEDAMLTYRVMRAAERRVFKFDVGNLPPSETDAFMKKMIAKIKKVPLIDQRTGEYNLKYNVMNIAEDFFLPVRGDRDGTSIDTLPAGQNTDAIEDIEYLQKKLFAALRIPKAFLTYEEGLDSKATLAGEDIRFARTIERLQKIIISELTKIAIVHLYSQGFRNEELIDFDLKLTNPSTVHEEQKLELISRRLDIAQQAAGVENIMDTDWAYKNIFNLSEEEITEVKHQQINDAKFKLRMEKIVEEGVDPEDEHEKEQNKREEEVENDFDKQFSAAKGDDESEGLTADKQDVAGRHTFRGGTPLALAHRVPSSTTLRDMLVEKSDASTPEKPSIEDIKKLTLSLSFGTIKKKKKSRPARKQKPKNKTQ